MPVENDPQTIEDLNALWPLDADLAKFGAAHLRAIKHVLKQTPILTQLRATVQNNTFPQGTHMLFVQSAAPVGWTKITTHNNKALRVVSGAASSGGDVSFTDAFSNLALSISTAVTVDSHTLTESQMPSHRHRLRSGTGFADVTTYRTTGSDHHGRWSPLERINGSQGNGGTYTGMENTGGGSAHNHSASATSTGSLNLNVAYVDVIICEKD